MKRILIIISTAFVLWSAVSTAVVAQVDEVSSATGLPIPIGAPVIYGQVSIEGLPRGERRPNIFVSLLVSGIQIDRRQTDDRGYFFFLQTPRHGHALLFEVDGGEVGRTYLIVGAGNRIRQDVTLNWISLKGASVSKTGVVSAGNYGRSSEAEKLFDRGMAAVREKKNENAVAIFEEMVVKDPKDYVVWTMLGTIFFSEKKYAEAETALAKASELKPDFFLARLNLGRMELNRKNYERAIESLTRAVELDAKSADANHFLGEAYLQAKKGSVAVGYLNKAIELEPVQKAEVHLRLAALYNGAGLRDRAAAEYRLLLKKVPDHPEKDKLEQYIKDHAPK